MPAVPGTYIKDGREQVAHTVAEAVQLRFDGWRLKPEPKPAHHHAPSIREQAKKDGETFHRSFNDTVAKDTSLNLDDDSSSSSSS